MPVRLFLIGCIFLQLLLAPGLGIAAALPEDLQYQVSLGPWSDVARLHMVLQETEPGHYRAEFFGAAQGMWSLLNRWLPERYSTEMVWREGRLLPLVYREEFEDKGQHVTKEYRFEHSFSRTTIWMAVVFEKMGDLQSAIEQYEKVLKNKYSRGCEICRSNYARVLAEMKLRSAKRPRQNRRALS